MKENSKDAFKDISSGFGMAFDTGIATWCGIPAAIIYNIYSHYINEKGDIDFDRLYSSLDFLSKKEIKQGVRKLIDTGLI